MFWKKKKEEPLKTMTFNIDEDEHFFGSKSELLTSEDVYWNLKRNHEYHGDLLVTNVTDELIEVTTVGTIENKESNRRLDELQDMLNTHIKGRMVSGTKGYLVISEGEVVKMFGDEVMANFEKMRIERTGVDEKDIKVQEIYVE